MDSDKLYETTEYHILQASRRSANLSASRDRQRVASEAVLKNNRIKKSHIDLT